MKTLVILTALSSLAISCTKKAPERAGATITAPAANPDAPTPNDLTPNNEMPGAPDSTNSVPGDQPPTRETIPERETMPPPGTTAPQPNGAPLP